MSISDLCSKRFSCIERSASLLQAAQLMKSQHVGGIVVIETKSKKKPVGILTDRDIVLSAVAESLPLSTRVEDVMSKEIVQVTRGKGIYDVVKEMEAKDVRRMIVVDEAGNACGLVSDDDILQLVTSELNSLGQLASHQVKKNKVHQPLQTQLLT